MHTLVSELAQVLIARKLHVAVAESCTGGMIGAALTDISGSSAYFSGGIIAYSNFIKEHILHVPANILQEYGAVSSQTVEAMAQGITALFRVS
jgi:nicotinamide-nucleotide amidase